MDNFTTRNAGLPSRRGAPLFAKAAFAFAAVAMASVLAASITDFDLAGWIHKPASANVAGADSFVAGTTSSVAGLTSFDDRFGSGAARNSSVISYPSRPVARSLRADFDTEFSHIESLLIGKLHDGSGPSTLPAPTVEAAVVPMPRSRPAEASVQVRNDPPPPAPSDSRTAFQKLADLVPMRFTLASLTPGDGLFAEKPDLGALGYDSQTAVYDILAHAVYLPNSGRLEAHSGLGSLMDDPSHVNQRMVGATPPGIYDLKPREKLFHGVAALRMTPLGESDALGRSGLLVHSYMLGPNGDSNGCVSIRDYNKFLTAYQNGEITRLVVVPSLREGLTASRRSTSPS
jgi:type VI secretion system (T6SS) effector TldE1-like protein